VKPPKALLSALIFILGFLLVIIIGFVDYTLEREFSLVLAYLIVIMGVTWYSNWGFGLFTALASTMAWVVADAAAGAVYNHPLALYWNTGSRLITYYAIVLLLSALKDKLWQAEALSTTDVLTGAMNRRGFNLLGELEIAKASRSNMPLTTAYVDVDDFKLLNDHHGHEEGDKALQLTTSVMQNNLRQSDTLARLGGDEFAIMLPATDSNTAQAVITRLHHALKETMASYDYAITFSIGVVTFTYPPMSVDALLQGSDKLMYEVKRDGKGKILYKEIDGQSWQDREVSLTP
jgi:diguanylate cyclase (GGDEF)-like protein